MNAQDIAGTASLLRKNWGLDHAPDQDWEALRAALRAHLRWMLAEDFERLVQAMYRLDVAESRFQQALAAPNLDARADLLAELVLDRERQRLATWRKYSQG